jgi:hypothetical protein
MAVVTMRACLDGNPDRSYNSIIETVVVERIKTPLITSGYVVLCCTHLFGVLDKLRVENELKMTTTMVDVGRTDWKWARFGRVREAKTLRWNLAAEDLDMYTDIADRDDVLSIPNLEVRAEKECITQAFGMRVVELAKGGIYR